MSDDPLVASLRRLEREHQRVLHVLHRLASQNLTQRTADPEAPDVMEACFVRADAEALVTLAEAGLVTMLAYDGDRYAKARSIHCPWTGEALLDHGAEEEAG